MPALPANAIPPGDMSDLTSAQQRRRHAIIEATTRLLGDREPSQIHMRDIAAEAGVALGTLYRYFPSKELLYAHCVAQWGRAFGDLPKGATRKREGDAERISRMLQRTVRAYERWPNFYRLIALLEIIEDGEARAVYQSFSQGYQALLAAMLVETTQEDAAIIVQMLLSSLGSALSKWSVGEWRIDQVHFHMSRAVGLIFGQPRRVIRPASASG